MGSDRPTALWGNHEEHRHLVTPKQVATQAGGQLLVVGGSGEKRFAENRGRGGLG